MTSARRRVVWVAVAAALAAANLLAVRASTLALSPPADSAVWAHGELALAGEPVRAGLFAVDGMLPGHPEVRCVVVRYEGDDAPADVRVYAAGVRGGLARFLDVVVETGHGCHDFSPASVAFAGTLEDLAGGWSTAHPSWHPREGDRLAYRVVMTLRPDPAAEGLDASADLVWEARAGGVAGQRAAGR